MLLMGCSHIDAGCVTAFLVSMRHDPSRRSLRNIANLMKKILQCRMDRAKTPVRVIVDATKLKARMIRSYDGRALDVNTSMIKVFHDSTCKCGRRL